jgi:lipoprotein-anchoring transpeptidase ErfK/SrfK
MRELIRPFLRRFTVAVFLSLAPLSGLQAAAAQDTGGVTAVRPGHFAWNAEAATAPGPVRVLVSLPAQLAFVFKGNALVGVSSVSSGVPGYDTPTGTFPILQKDRDHKSNLYEDAPMPFMLRLTWDGVALHAGKVTGEPASHGCVRLPAAFARRLFEIADVGATVSIVAEMPATLPVRTAAEGEAAATEPVTR